MVSPIAASPRAPAAEPGRPVPSPSPRTPGAAAREGFHRWATSVQDRPSFAETFAARLGRGAAGGGDDVTLAGEGTTRSSGRLVDHGKDGSSARSDERSEELLGEARAVCEGCGVGAAPLPGLALGESVAAANPSRDARAVAVRLSELSGLVERVQLGGDGRRTTLRLELAGSRGRAGPSVVVHAGGDDVELVVEGLSDGAAARLEGALAAGLRERGRELRSFTRR